MNEQDERDVVIARLERELEFQRERADFLYKDYFNPKSSAFRLEESLRMMIKAQDIVFILERIKKG